MQENTENLPAIKVNRFWLWLFLLAVSILAAIATYYFQDDIKQTPEELYLAFYQPSPNEIDPIASSALSGDQSAFQSYELGNYEEAISTFIPNLSDKHARWYFAQSMMAKEDVSAARDIFMQFVRNRDAEYGVPSSWYIALINIKEGQIEEAKNQLNQISLSSHSIYKKKAAELLDKLGE